MTCVLVWDDLDTLNVTGSLEDLSKNIFGDTLVQSADIQCALVRLRGSTSAETTGAAGGHDLVDARHRGGDGRGDRVVVLRDVQGRRRLLAILKARCTLVALGWSRQLGCVGSGAVGHCV